MRMKGSIAPWPSSTSTCFTACFEASRWRSGWTRRLCAKSRSQRSRSRYDTSTLCVSGHSTARLCNASLKRSRNSDSQRVWRSASCIGIMASPPDLGNLRLRDISTSPPANHPLASTGDDGDAHGLVPAARRGSSPQTPKDMSVDAWPFFRTTCLEGAFMGRMQNLRA